jgi:glycosyltransferase involved in cell wall biosynthesis
LKLAVDSVFAQTFADWELIVADDGSNEETRDYLRQLDFPRVKILWLVHSGNPSRTRNAALGAASGRYVAFLDSDDAWWPRKLEQQLAALRASSHCRWSYTACDRIDADGNPLPPAFQPKTAVRSGWIFEPLLALEVSVAMPTLIAERSEIDAVGAFDEQQLYGEFHDLCLRLALRSEAVAVAEVLCSIRAHDEHYSACTRNSTALRRLRAHAPAARKCGLTRRSVWRRSKAPSATCESSGGLCANATRCRGASRDSGIAAPSRCSGRWSRGAARLGTAHNGDAPQYERGASCLDRHADVQPSRLLTVDGAVDSLADAGAMGAHRRR